MDILALGPDTLSNIIVKAGMGQCALNWSQATVPIAALVSALTPKEGSQPGAVEGVTLLRISEPLPRMPVLYEPSIVFVAQGTKRGFASTRKPLRCPRVNRA